MLANPFTPADIASAPDAFFGRAEELGALERSLLKGSVAIEGPIGIGKSSLMARGLLMMEGFASIRRAKSVVAVADKGVQTIDEAARLVLETFVSVDEQRNGLKLKIGSVLEFESAELCAFFKEGRHLAALKRMVEQEYLERFVADTEMLIVAIDEADKAPVPLAQLIRSIVTHTQQLGIQHVRFLLAGVRPFFQQMVTEDAGITRFFYKTIALNPMTSEEALELVHAKLQIVIGDAESHQLSLRVDPQIAPRIVSLSGGHPHILQLLGSHLVEHEDDDPDGILDSKDLLNSLRRVCYEDRAYVYQSTLHHLDVNGKLEPLRILLGLDSESPPGIVSESFPTSIPRSRAMRSASKGDIHWLVEHNVLSTPSEKAYGLVDEFLRIRLILDQMIGDRLEGPPEVVERGIIERASTSSYWEKPMHIDELEEDLEYIQVDEDDDFDEEDPDED